MIYPDLWQIVTFRRGIKTKHLDIPKHLFDPLFLETSWMTNLRVGIASSAFNNNTTSVQVKIVFRDMAFDNKCRAEYPVTLENLFDEGNETLPMAMDSKS
jgi:hypothetical protein